MSHRLQVLIPEGLDARIRKAAQRSRLSKGEWVRRAIERALADERAPADPLARLASLGGPTADIEQMLAEIEAGRSWPCSSTPTSRCTSWAGTIRCAIRSGASWSE